MICDENSIKFIQTLNINIVMEQQQLPEETQSNSLIVLIEESGLEEKSITLLKDQLAPLFEEAAIWKKEVESIKVTSLDQVAEMKRSRELRLEGVKRRGVVDKILKASKSEAKKVCDHTDLLNRTYKGMSDKIEEIAELNEKFAERHAKEQADKLFAERLEALKPYCDASLWRLAEMPKEQFEAVLEAEKLKYEQKVELDAKMVIHSNRVMLIKKEYADDERLAFDMGLTVDTDETDWQRIIGELETKKKEKEEFEKALALKEELFDARKEGLAPYALLFYKKEEDGALTIDTTEEEWNKIMVSVKERKHQHEVLQEKNRKKLAEMEKEKQEKEAREKRDQLRTKELMALGLIFDSETFTYKDISFKKEDVFELSDESYKEHFAIWKDRMNHILEIEKKEHVERKKIEYEKVRKHKELEETLTRDKKEKERMDKLLLMGLIYDGQQFIYKDINFHWTEIKTMSDQEFSKAVSGANKRMDEITKEEEKAAKDKLAAEKKAAKAPDKVQLQKWIDQFSIPEESFISKTVEGQKIYDDIIIKFSSFKKWGKDQIDNM